MGVDEVARRLGRSGSARVKQAVLVSCVPPLKLETANHPGCLSIECRRLARGVAGQSPTDLAECRPGLFLWLHPLRGQGKSRTLIQSFWVQSMQSVHENTYRSISAPDFREDLKKFDVLALVIHGDDDQVVPIEVSDKV